MFEISRISGKPGSRYFLTTWISSSPNQRLNSICRSFERPLAAEDDRDVVAEGVFDFRKGAIVQLRGEIEFDFGAAGVSALGD